MTSLAVVAIGFGTTYTRVAFSFRHEYERDPTRVSLKHWQGGTRVSQKAPTCILIKPDGKTADSFGYDAESKYAEIAEEYEQDKWFFFQRFDMLLFKDQGFTRSASLEEESGKKLPAMTVFSLLIDYLKKDILDTRTFDITGLDVDDIHWVFTVPALSNDEAKYFMREAAQKAGIPEKKLAICSEQEGAFIYCRHIQVSRSSGGEKTSSVQLSSGTKYLVLDAGATTVDITVHEVTTNDDLKELYKATGGPWGVNQVDRAYEEFLSSITGRDVIQQFKKQHTDDYIEIFKDFGCGKHNVSKTKDERITFRIPYILIKLCCEMTGKDLRTLVMQSRFNGKINVRSDKVRIDADVVREFFHPTIKRIIDHVAVLLKQPSVLGCAAILMVGEFCDLPILQENVRAAFPELQIIVPDDADSAALKGAVIFGHKLS